MWWWFIAALAAYTTGVLATRYMIMLLLNSTPKFIQSLVDSDNAEQVWTYVIWPIVWVLAAMTVILVVFFAVWDAVTRKAVSHAQSVKALIKW
mgnify:CR=1 FL=1